MKIAREASPAQSRIMAVGLIATALALLLFGQQIRVAEASLQAHVLQFVGMYARRVGTAVIFPMNGHFVGVAFTLGCSIGPLAALFLGGAGIASWLRPLRLRSVVIGGLSLVALFVLVNQIRIAVIVGSMRLMGFQRGYEFSHVFLGSAITTLGFVAAVVLFVRLLLRAPQRVST